MPDPSHPDLPTPLGGPASPFDTDEIRPIRKPLAQDSPSSPSPPAEDDGYELEGGGVAPRHKPTPIPLPLSERPMTRPVEEPPAPPRPKSKARPKESVMPLGSEESGSTEFLTEVSEVDPEWTRLGEWGPDLAKVVGVGLGTLFLTWLTSGLGTPAVFLFLAGGAATALLSYPLLITLERPVRITPEQAVDDFFAAASHHFPHYRRMWLLLSVAGRRSGRFETFEEFRDHWKSRVARWKATKGLNVITPLTFEVEHFQADKSSGKETSRADYTINIYPRGGEADGPIESVRMVHGLVKGPDRMWYLNRGTLDPVAK